MTTPNEATSTALSATPAAPPSDVTAGPSQTREHLTKVAARGYTVIRNSFVQERRGGKWVGSSLGRLVKARQPRALRAYLMLLMSWSALDRRPVPLEAAVWARALSPDPPAPPWPASAMSRVWATLAEPPHRLIAKERKARLVRLAPRKENGRAPYTRPRPDESANPGEKFFVLPDAFWLEGWHQELRLPGVAMLLILLQGTTGRDEAWMSPEHAEEWYGIAEKTMRNGLEELRAAGLMVERREWVTEPLSPIGKTQRLYCSLTGPFSRQERQRLQAAATRATKKRVAQKNRRTKPRPAEGGSDAAA